MNPIPTFTRRISPMTLALVEHMATDPASPRPLREFHQTQLADLKHRAALQAHVFKKASPFSRFADALGSEGNPETV